MIVLIQGTRTFSDYNIFLRAMGTALSMKDPDDNEFYVYAVGTANINSMALEFMNITERSLKSKNIKSRLYKVPVNWGMENISSVDYFAFFSKPKEPVTKLVDLAEAKDVELGIYRF